MKGSRPKIVQAIKEALASGITPHTLKSILADTRKLLELDDPKRTYRTLKFYCDWPLHTKLEGTYARDLLAFFDGLLSKWVEHHTGFSLNEQSRIAYEIAFYGFEKELSEFMARYNIPFPSVATRAWWVGFETVYCNIVEDAWLEYPKSKKAPSLRMADSAQVATFLLSQHPDYCKHNPGDFLPLGIMWSFLKDDQVKYRFPVTFPSEELCQREAAGQDAQIQAAPARAPLLRHYNKFRLQFYLVEDSKQKSGQSPQH